MWYYDIIVEVEPKVEIEPKVILHVVVVVLRSPLDWKIGPKNRSTFKEIKNYYFFNSSDIALTTECSFSNLYQVCSIHFLDDRPTKDHPYPSLQMGYIPHVSIRNNPSQYIKDYFPLVSVKASKLLIKLHMYMYIYVDCDL